MQIVFTTVGYIKLGHLSRKMYNTFYDTNDPILCINTFYETNDPILCINTFYETNDPIL